MVKLLVEQMEATTVTTTDLMHSNGLQTCAREPAGGALSTDALATLLRERAHISSLVDRLENATESDGSLLAAVEWMLTHVSGDLATLVGLLDIHFLVKPAPLLERVAGAASASGRHLLAVSALSALRDLRPERAIDLTVAMIEAAKAHGGRYAGRIASAEVTRAEEAGRYDHAERLRAVASKLRIKIAEGRETDGGEATAGTPHAASSVKARLLNVDEVATYVGFSRRTVLRMVEKREMPEPQRPLGPGTDPRWDVHDLDRWIGERGQIPRQRAEKVARIMRGG